MADSKELRALVGAMTERPWGARLHGSMGPHDYEISGPDMMVPYCERNDAVGIVALANHADALVELIAACEGFGDRNVPQYVAVQQVLIALAKVHAVGKETT